MSVRGTSRASVPGLPTARTWIWKPERVETILQIQNDLAALDPEQMVPGARDIAVLETDGEDIDMPRRDLQRVPTMVEKFRVTAIEPTWPGGLAFPSAGHRWPAEQGFGHSCATSLA